MLAVALTGGIGSGKSTVSHQLESLGVPVIDADLLAHQMVEPGSPALQEIQSAFGTHLVDPQGQLDRAALRKIVFDSPAERKRLEAILHPRIKQAMQVWLSTQSAPYAVLVIPLLFEAKQTDLADRILVVDIDESLQIQRVKTRDALAEEEIINIIHAQADRMTRLNGADDVIVNNGNREELIAATNRQHEFYLTIAEQYSGSSSD